MQKLPLTNKEFKDIYSRVPRLCVDVIINTDEGVLLTLRKEKSWQGLWHIPGGTVYYKESLGDAVRRVAREELGVDISIEKVLGYIEYFDEEKERGFGYAVSIEFLCNLKESVFTLSEQATEAKFFKSLPPNIIHEQEIFIKKHLNIK